MHNAPKQDSGVQESGLLENWWIYMQPETFRRWIKSLRFHIEDQLVTARKS